jgi:uncharacterized membrane protein YeaQ/YmgE (transglycosylase-associated protein family)
VAWIGLIVIGLIAGYVARIVVPGPDPIGLIGTLILGVVGSFVGGFLWSLMDGGGGLITRSGPIGSIIGAIIVLLVYRAVNTRRA